MGLKMPCDEGVAGGITPEEAEEIVKIFIAEGGLDYFAFSQGNFSPSLENHLPDMHFAKRPYQHLHARMKYLCGDIPVVTLGRIESPAAAEQLLVEGCGDLVGFSRALISDAAATAGRQALAWDGRDTQGHTVAPGVYILRVCVEGDALTRSESRLISVAY